MDNTHMSVRGWREALAYDIAVSSEVKQGFYRDIERNLAPWSISAKRWWERKREAWCWWMDLLKALKKVECMESAGPEAELLIRYLPILVRGRINNWPKITAGRLAKFTPRSCSL
jgi:hypothetical protein